MIGYEYPRRSLYSTRTAANINVDSIKPIELGLNIELHSPDGAREINPQS